MIATAMLAGAGGARAAVTMSVSSVDEGAGTATVTIQRSGLDALSFDQTFSLSTLPGTATAPDDYAATPSPSSLSFSIGETSESATIGLVDDVLDEEHETFQVIASGPVAVSGSPATSTITDDDALPVLAVRDAGVTEGTGGTSSAMSFPVDVGVASGRAMTFDWTVVEDTGAAAPATVGTDLAAQAGSITIPAGETRATIPVDVAHDNVDEPDETIRVVLSNPINAALTGDGARDAGTGTIANDDTPSLGVANETIVEGNAGTSTIDFKIRLSNPSSRTVSVDYATSDFPGAETASAGSDYQPVSGTVRWTPGDTGPKTVSVPVLGDLLPEGHELLVFNLANASGALVAPAALGGILNDDGGQVVQGATGTGTGTGFDALTPSVGGTKPRLSGLGSPKPGTLRVTVACPATSAVCRGQMSVLTIVRPKSRFRALRRERTFGTLRVNLTRGAKKTYTLRLSRTLRREYRGIKKVRVAAYAILRDRTGPATAVQTRGTVRISK